MDDLTEKLDQNETIEAEINSLTEDLARKQPARNHPPPAAQSRQHPLLFPVTMLLLIIGVLATVANIAGIGPFRRGMHSPSQREKAQQSELDALAAIGYIEDFVASHRHLPETLEEALGFEPPKGISYERVDDDTYRIYQAGEQRRLIYENRLNGEEATDG